MSVIARVDHGYYTFTSSLITQAGDISKAATGTVRVTDIGEKEKERGITMKSTGVSIYCDYELDVLQIL